MSFPDAVPSMRQVGFKHLDRHVTFMLHILRDAHDGRVDAMHHWFAITSYSVVPSSRSSAVTSVNPITRAVAARNRSAGS